VETKRSGKPAAGKKRECAVASAEQAWAAAFVFAEETLDKNVQLCFNMKGMFVF
jgi:hypothetical protein